MLRRAGEVRWPGSSSAMPARIWRWPARCTGGWSRLARRCSWTRIRATGSRWRRIGLDWTVEHAHHQLGGVQGALIRQADAALADAIAAGSRSREQVIAGLLRLVTVDEQGRPTRWRVHRAELPDHVVTELNAFVARRLLTTDNGTVVIGVAHEKFLSAWPPLAETIAKNVTALRARRAIEHAATEWYDGGRPPARL